MKVQTRRWPGLQSPEAFTGKGLFLSHSVIVSRPQSPLAVDETVC